MRARDSFLSIVKLDQLQGEGVISQEQIFDWDQGTSRKMSIEKNDVLEKNSKASIPRTLFMVQAEEGSVCSLVENVSFWILCLPSLFDGWFDDWSKPSWRSFPRNSLFWNTFKREASFKHHQCSNLSPCSRAGFCYGASSKRSRVVSAYGTYLLYWPA